MTLESTRRKLSKYYNQTQNEFELLYDKTILLHFIVDETLFQISKWKMKSEETSWHKMYWSVLKEMYNEYKQHTIESNSQIKQFNREVQSQTLNDILSDDVKIQTSSKKNEFTSYQRQDMIDFTFFFSFY